MCYILTILEFKKLPRLEACIGLHIILASSCVKLIFVCVCVCVCVCMCMYMYIYTYIRALKNYFCCFVQVLWDCRFLGYCAASVGSL
jgi:hypothetical protein